MCSLGAFILSITLCAGPSPAAAAWGPTPFDAARRVPADLTLYLHAEDAANIRTELANRPIGDLFHRLLRTGEASDAWHGLARAAGLTDEALFDAWLGRRFTFLTRPAGEEADWALICEVDRRQAREVLRRLNPRRLAPRHQLPVSELPEHELLIASEGSTYLIGPTRPGRLFDELVGSLAGVSPPATPLAHDPAMTKASSLGAGELGLFLRHELPLGGYSLFVLDLDGRRVLLHHAGHYENPPFQRPVTELAWDPAPLEAFRDKALLAVVEPTDIGGGPVEVFIEAALDTPLLSPSMRRNLDKRRMFVVGEIEGRQEEHKTDLLLPTLSVAIEIRDPKRAEVELDEHVLHCAEAMNRQARRALKPSPDAASEGGQEAPQIDIPSIHTFQPGETRQIDLAPLMERYGPDQPLLQSVTLDWSVTSGPFGNYCVVATHPEQLRQTIEALQSPCDGPTRREKMTSAGFLDGRRMARQLQSFGEQAELLAEADPRAVTSFRETMQLLSELAAGIERCCWELRRPSEKEVRIEARIILAEPDSAGGR
ncbi:MAG: hypothetical protein SYC29_18595 [Planctomycetota bacterium]|nr:hypothetical protein [Planctomycetota bacterium]